MALLPAAACSAPSARTPARSRDVPQMMDGCAVIDEPALRLVADVRPGYDGRRSPGADAETEGFPPLSKFLLGNAGVRRQTSLESAAK